MGGKACIRGMRVTVGNLVGQIGADRTVEERPFCRTNEDLGGYESDAEMDRFSA